jgi:acetoin utilization protein AcuB
MLVSQRMTRNPVTILDTANIDDGLHLMRTKRVRRLPVLDASGQMVGIVSDSDLLQAAPSPATSLSVHELHYLLSRLTVRQVMSTPVVSVTPDTPLEEAARIMADNKIGGLPVMEGGRLVGIITETDVFKALLDMLGARTPGLRVTVAVKEGRGVLARLSQAVSGAGANIISAATYSGREPSERFITIKVDGVERQVVEKALAGSGVEVIDIRAG